MKLPNIYAKDYYRYYLLVSVAVLVIALALLPGVRMGIDLAGGTRITAMDTNTMDTHALEQALVPYGLEDLSVKFIENPLTGRKGVIIEYTGNHDIIRAEQLVGSSPSEAIALLAPFVESDESLGTNATADRYLEVAKTDFRTSVQDALMAFTGVTEEQVSSTEVGAALGQQFWESSLRALLVAFILVAAVVFILFREVMPTFAVLQAAVFDIIVALAGMSFFGIPLTLPTIAALLLMIGYSVDTDILVTERVLKRKDHTPRERAYGALITGLTVTGTTLTVVLILAIFSYFNQMTTIFQIASVLLFGLMGDLPATWFTNTVLITWWAERKKK